MVTARELADLQDAVNEARADVVNAEKALDVAEKAFNKAYDKHWAINTALV